ncbi:MAG: DoxX family protein [Acidobacteria bacterium]|nr:DoxX family protein [Acidobacteriota bacterium]
MKIAVIIVRTLVGLLFTLSSVAYFANLVPQPELTGPLKTFTDGLAASGYFMTLLKVTELICGIALISGYFVPLALVILAPIVINIFFVHLMLAPEGMPIAGFLVLANIFLGYGYRKSYEQLFVPRQTF